VYSTITIRVVKSGTVVVVVLDNVNVSLGISGSTTSATDQG